MACAKWLRMTGARAPAAWRGLGLLSWRLRWCVRRRCRRGLGERRRRRQWLQEVTDDPLDVLSSLVLYPRIVALYPSSAFEVCQRFGNRHGAGYASDLREEFSANSGAASLGFLCQYDIYQQGVLVERPKFPKLVHLSSSVIWRTPRILF